MKINKKHISKYLLLVALSSASLASCEDDFDTHSPEMSDKISYGVNLTNISQTKESRSSHGSVNEGVDVACMDYKLHGDSLYLFTIVSDSIPSGIKVGDNRAKQSQSRGAVTTGATMSDMGVTAIVYDGEWTDDATDYNIYMSNEKSVAPNWVTDRYWPLSGTKMRFFAYSPYESITLPNSETSPEFDFEIDATASLQEDLLVASSDVVSPNGYHPADLTFAHALTAVRFEVANNVTDITVKAVRINGVYYRGSYKYKYSGANKDDGDDSTPYSSDMGEWTVVTTGDNVLRDFELKDLNVACTGESSTNIALNEGENVMMLLPQTLPAGATLEIDIHDAVMDKDVTLKADIAGNVWGKGTSVTYCISASKEIVEYVLETEVVSQPEFYGGEGSLKVTSYKKTSRFGNVKIEPVAWSISDFGDSDEMPVWLEEIQMSGTGVSDEVDYELITFKTGTAPLTQSHTHKHLIVGASRGTYDAPYDLSTEGGTTSQNTANCYMVGYVGYYKLPLVYGNALLDGSFNQHAHGGDYYDHKGVAWLTDAWITSRYTPHSVSIVWQDAPGLVTDLRLVDDNKYLAFEVPSHTACDGNAVVAVKDENGDIMWSWHIWVTQYVSTWNGDTYSTCTDVKEKTIRNKTYGLLNSDGYLVDDNGNILDTAPFDGYPEGVHGTYWFTLLTKYLGYCAGEVKKYEGTIEATFAQAEGDVSKTIELTSQSRIVDTANNSCYYQFGRKDPIIGYGEIVNSAFQNKTCYGADGEPIEFNYTSSSASSIAETIKNPDVFYGSGSDQWCSNANYQFLWNCYNYVIPTGGTTIKTLVSQSKVSKTIYDPCPVGYVMPRSDAFTGFLLDSENPNKLVQGCPEEYYGYYVDTADDSGYKYYTTLPDDADVWSYYSNNNGNILREPNPCAFVSGYGEYAYWFRPDVNGAGKFDGSFDAEDSNAQSLVYDQCLMLMALGYRGATSTSGDVAEYRHMGNVLTATLVDKDGTGAKPSRLYFYHDHNAQYFGDEGELNCRGHVAHTAQNLDTKTYTLFSSSNSIITVASSRMSLGFTVLPAKEGFNGYTK